MLAHCERRVAGGGRRETGERDDEVDGRDDTLKNSSTVIRAVGRQRRTVFYKEYMIWYGIWVESSNMV